MEGELEGGGRSSSGHAVMFSHAALMWLDEVKHVTSNTPLSDQLIDTFCTQ